jgi:uncharacterized membrane protein HdeD (DUF308 family)
MAITVNEASTVLKVAVRDAIRRRWVLFLIQGGTLVAAGLVALVFPAFNYGSLLELLGLLLIVSAIASGISLIGVGKVPFFWMQIASVILDVVVGWILLTRADTGLGAVTMLMMVLFLTEGVLGVTFAMMIRPMKDWYWMLASGLVSILAALGVVYSLPETPIWMLSLLLAAHLISTGGAIAALAWRAKADPATM